MGRRHYLCGNRRRRVLPVARNGRLLAQDRGLGAGADARNALPAQSPAHGARHDPARTRARLDTPLRQGLPILQLRVRERTQETGYRHQHDAERRPARECHRRTRKRHLENRMAVQEEVRNPRGMPSRTREDNPVLQRRTTAHEHRDADSRRSARAGRTAKEVLEDASRTTGGKEKDIFGGRRAGRQ